MNIDEQRIAVQKYSRAKEVFGFTEPTSSNDGMFILRDKFGAVPLSGYDAIVIVNLSSVSVACETPFGEFAMVTQFPEEARRDRALRERYTILPVALVLRRVALAALAAKEHAND